MDSNDNNALTLEEQLFAAQRQVLELLAENAHQRAMFEKEKRGLEAMVIEYRRVAESSSQEIQNIRNSRAYRMTKPLRNLRGSQ